jgi:asparagine synthase (glutamine-hydrolysing)
MNPLRKVVAYMPLELLPKSLRASILAKRLLRLPWLRPAARRRVIRRYLDANKEGNEDVLWNLRKLRDSRYFELARGAFAAFAEEAGALLCEPFFDFRFHRVAVATTPPGGYPSRNDALATLFGDLLPPRSLHRMSKAVFTEVFWGPDSRDFAERWDGGGLDPGIIDPDALREQWARPRPDLRSITPLQAAWLHADRAAAESR